MKLHRWPTRVDAIKGRSRTDALSAWIFDNLALDGVGLEPALDDLPSISCERGERIRSAGSPFGDFIPDRWIISEGDHTRDNPVATQYPLAR